MVLSEYMHTVNENILLAMDDKETLEAKGAYSAVRAFTEWVTELGTERRHGR